MNANVDQWVPKVHPLARPAETDDPFELMAQPIAGDPQVMLEALLQEFLWMGWGEAEMMRLFCDPGYPVLCQLREHFGDDAIRQHVRSLLSRTGVIRFRETLAEPDDEKDEPELVQITIPPGFCR
jgi:hypothetical protein